MEVAESPLLGSLKAHKSLPHRKPLADGTTTAGLTERDKISRSRVKREGGTYTTSDRIKSWIPEPSPIHVIPVIGVPLTPPLNFRDTFRSWLDDAALRDHTFSQTHASESAGTTPLVQQSPPTPETTPPRTANQAEALPKVANFSPTERPSHSRAETSRNPSDSTQSFQTALENFSSDDEGLALDSPSLHPARQKWSRDTRVVKHRDVGLGLGLESEDGEPTPKEMTPLLSPRREDLIVFNGAWGADTMIPDLDEKHESQRFLGREMAQRKDQQRHILTTYFPEDSPTLGAVGGLSLAKPLRLGECIEQNQRDSPLTLAEKATEQGRRSRREEAMELDDELRGINKNRLSQASTSSTIVSAMVIESPPRRRQTLRHTGKMIGMNSISLQQRSDQGSSGSRDHSLRRRLGNGRNPEEGLRAYFGSDDSESRGCNATKAKQESASLVVIPDHRSSIQSFTSSSKRISRTLSFTSRQQSSRPTAAPEKATGYFDQPRRDLRPMSIVVQQATPLGTENEVVKELSSPTSADNSPPSIPTSRGPEVSRTTSVTSTGMMTHYPSQTPTGQAPANLQILDTRDAQNIGVERSSTGEWSVFHPRSALVTPFSLQSAHSSTPGTLEVNEATAISIYPHTNKSILVIQQMPSENDSQASKQRSAIMAGNVNIAISAPVTPAAHEGLLFREIVNSPLQNPRDPPQPPDQTTPATPANGPLYSEHTRTALVPASRPNRFSAPLSSLKRALSARRYSESFASPFSRTSSLRNAASSARRRLSLAEDPVTSKLHSFWRPRLGHDSDSDSEFGNEGILPTQRSRSQVTSKRTMSLSRRLTGSLQRSSVHRPRDLSYPLSDQEFVVDDSPSKQSPTLRRRLWGSLRLPSRRPKFSTAGSLSDQPDYEFVHPGLNANEAKRRESVPRQGHQVQFVGFRGLAEKLERRRETKEEERTDERRERLKGRIGVVAPECAREDVEAEVKRVENSMGEMGL